MTSPYEYCTIYGPYISKRDGRARIFLKWPNGDNTTISFAKFLMEEELGRYLVGDEETHHIDEDPTNDSIDNLEVLKRAEHRQLHANGRTIVKSKCSHCGKELERELRHIRKGQINIFCSRRCNGKHNQYYIK